MNIKDIPNYENLYAASEDGRIYSHRKKKFMTSNPVGKYLQVTLYKDGARKNFTVHKLIALTWIPNPNSLPHVGHLDENSTNNAVSNLYWTDVLDNNNMPLHKERISVSKSKQVYCEETKQIYRNARVAAEELGLCRQSVDKVCRGQRSHTGGYHFRFIDS